MSSVNVLSALSEQHYCYDCDMYYTNADGCYCKYSRIELAIERFDKLNAKIMKQSKQRREAKKNNYKG